MTNGRNIYEKIVIISNNRQFIFSKYKIECKPIYWKDMDSLDKNIYLILKKYNKDKEPTIKQCRKVDEKEIKNEKK